MAAVIIRLVALALALTMSIGLGEVYAKTMEPRPSFVFTVATGIFLGLVAMLATKGVMR